MEDGQPVLAVQVEESLGAIPNSHVPREDEAETSECSGGALITFLWLLLSGPAFS